MPDHDCFGCAHWSRRPDGSGGYKAGTCAQTMRMTTAIETCPSWQRRPVDYARWGWPAPPAPEPTPPAVTTAEAGAWTQGALL